MDEFLVLTIIFSGMVLMFLYLALTCIFNHVTQFMVYIGLACFLFVLGVLVDPSSESFGAIDSKLILSLFGLLTCFFMGLLISSLYLPSEYWRGSDGWSNVVALRKIAETGFSPMEAYNFFKGYIHLSNPGFYYYFSALHLMTGFSVESIMRYGGLVQTGLFVSLAYITFKRVNGLLPGLSGAFLLALNPYFNQRFMVLLREEFGLFFLFAGVFFYVCYRESGHWSPVLRVIVMSGLLASCLLSHPLVPVFFIGLLVCQMGYLLIERNFSELQVDLYSFFLGLMLVLPLHGILLDPLIYFVGKISSSHLLAGGGLAIAVTASLFMFYTRKPDLDALFPVVKRVLVVFMFVLPVLGVTAKPNLGESYSFGFIDVEDFSRILVPLSIAGYFLYYLRSMGSMVAGLNLVTSSLVALSYLGVPVPLDRLSVPLTWLMSFYSSYLLKESMRFSFRGAEIYKQGSYSVSRLLDHRMTLAFILMIAAGGVIELSTVTRNKSVFDASDVVDTSLFVSELEPSELVFPYGISEHMLYYADISRGNIFADLRLRKELLELLDHGSVYEVSDVIHDNYPDADALVFYMDSWDEYSIREKPFGRLLDVYFERTVYGDFSSYRMDVPFTVDKLKLEQIKYVEDLPGGPVLGSEGDIVAVSNCLVSTGGGAPYSFLFLREGGGGSRYLGLASSTDGATWGVEHEEELGYELESLSLVEHGGRIYLYAGTSSRDQVVRLDSRDLRSWANYTVVIDYSSREELIFLESPLAWQEDEILGMLWWETMVGDSMVNGVRYSTSADGVNWETNPEPLGWVLMDSRYRAINYDKILPCDLVRNGDGVTVLARMHVANATFSMSWATGSISLEDFASKAAGMRCFVYKDHLGSWMESVHVIGDVEGSGVRFIYLEDGGGGVLVGAASDHHGLEEECLALP